jgi:hypothetical protein
MKQLDFAYFMKSHRSSNRSTYRRVLSVCALLFIGVFQSTGLSAQDCDPLLELVCPEEVTIECGDEGDVFVTGLPEVTIDCVEGEVTLYYTDELVESGCEQIIARTWVAEVDDLVQLCTQLIYTEDTTGPALLDVPADLEVDCVEEVPEMAEISGVDQCGELENIGTYTSETGNATDSCSLSTAVGPGDDWAIWLPILVADGIAPSVAWNFVGDASMIMYADGTAEISGIIQNSGDESLKFAVDFKFQNEMNWDDWSEAGRNYKDDLGIAADYHQDWMPWLVVNYICTTCQPITISDSNVVSVPTTRTRISVFQDGSLILEWLTECPLKEMAT